METVWFQMLGTSAFFIGTLLIGRHIRRVPTRVHAERLSRVSHALFWGGLVLPVLVGAVHPGLTKLDGLLGLASLPRSSAVQVPGYLMLVIGGCCVAASSLALKEKGFGFAAFKLTRHVVEQDIYGCVRNPMSLGTYLAWVGASLIVGSSYLLVGTLVVVIPVHVFNLVYFEERELLARHGAWYAGYLKRVPFIIPSVSCRART